MKDIQNYQDELAAMVYAKMKEENVDIGFSYFSTIGTKDIQYSGEQPGDIPDDKIKVVEKALKKWAKKDTLGTYQFVFYVDDKNDDDLSIDILYTITEGRIDEKTILFRGNPKK